MVVHTYRQTDIRTYIHTWLISGLFYELKVEFIAECFLLEALLDGQLYHGDTVVWLHPIKTIPT